MKNLRLKSYAMSLCTATTFFSGCGGPQPPISAAHDQASTMMGADARSLLYVAGGRVEAYTYPRGKLVGSIGWGGYLCSDRSGNIIIAGGEGISYVWVFPHGGSNPIATLYNPENAGGCSVEQGGENIAVASADVGALVVFPYKPKRGWRLARDYHIPNIRVGQYCTYDPQGDIFVDGYGTSTSFVLVELPKGSSTFVTIALDHVVNRPGSMQWDGKDLVIEDAGKTSSSAAVIYRFAINGSSGHEVSATTLTDSVADAQFLIYGRTVIGPSSNKSVQGIGVWHFPRGGMAFRTLATNFRASGEALSLK